MTQWSDWLAWPFPAFGLLVVARMTAMCHTFPMLVEYPIPVRLRLALSALLALLVAPSALLRPLSPQQVLALSWENLFAHVIQEVVIGMALGMSVGIVLSSIRVVAGMVDVGSLSLWGTHFAETTDEAPSTTGQLFLWVALLAFLGIHGERQVLSAFMDSFVDLPVGELDSSATIVRGLVDILQSSLLIGWRVALPISCAGLFALISVAILGRLSPAGHVMFMAMPALQLASVGMLCVGIGSITWMYAHELERAWQELGSILTP